MSTLELKSRLLKMGISPKKAFGQNFLLNKHVIEKIIDEVAHSKFNDLIEIGPGLGALTEPLLARDFKPRLIELDPELVTYWNTRGLSVVAEDALQVDWPKLELKAPALLVSNLPYNISTSIVVDRCMGPESLKWMVLMFQKEVAQRLMARPKTKEYGFLSVLAQLHFKIRKVADASPRDFYPAPKVASRVLSFERLDVEGLGRPFLRFVKQAFAYRRKLLVKNLGGSVTAKTLSQLGFGEKIRAEELAPGDFEKLFKAVHEY